MILKNIISQFRKKYFPTPYEKELHRWWSDNGDFTLRLNYPLSTDSLVLDLGGFQGQWTSDLFAKYRCKIIIFEPVAEYARYIKDRFTMNDMIDVRAYGLGGRSYRTKIGVCGPGSSIFIGSSKNEEIQILNYKLMNIVSLEKRISNDNNN